MTTNITAGELDLLSFFEIEPKRLDRDIPWPYNDLLYEVAQGNFALSFSVAPSVRDVRVLLKCEGELIYELNAVGI
jgi:hypothetical protein